MARRGNVSALIKSAGQKGFYKTAVSLAGQEGVRDPEKLSGWLKAEAKKRGVLSPEHKYRGRSKARGKKASVLRNAWNMMMKRR